MTENIKCHSGFTIVELVNHMADVGAQVGHIELVTVCTDTQRITLYVGVKAIEDVTPKLQVVK